MRSAIAASAAIAAFAFATTPAQAQTNHGHGGHGTPQAALTDVAASSFSEGTVRRVDAAARKLTIAHGPLTNLGMPPMTMMFEVAKDISLEGISAGDRIRFVAHEENGTFSVLQLEAAR
jgi:Cu/Ag efflux protein CusF